MPRSPRTDPAILDRLRRARAAEDTALGEVGSAQARLDTTTARRATVLADLDTAVTNAEAELAHARANLVTVAGLDRAAVALGISPAVLRRSLPRDKHPAEPARPPQRTRQGDATAPSTAGGHR